MAKLAEFDAGQLTGEITLLIQRGILELKIGTVNSPDYLSIRGTREEMAEFVDELVHLATGNYAKGLEARAKRGD